MLQVHCAQCSQNDIVSGVGGRIEAAHGHASETYLGPTGVHQVSLSGAQLLYAVWRSNHSAAMLRACLPASSNRQLRLLHPASAVQTSAAVCRVYSVDS